MPHCISRLIVLALLSSRVAFAQGVETTYRISNLEGFKTDGVTEPVASHLQNIAAGRWAELAYSDFGGPTLYYQLLLNGYINAYGFLCSGALPKDKVEWIIERCKADSPRDENGKMTKCVHDDLHTHVFMDRNIDQLKHELLFATQIPMELTPDGPRLSLSSIGDAIRSVQNKQAREYYEAILAAPVQVVTSNGCMSSQLRRFQNNLLRLGMGIPMLTPFVAPVAPIPHPSTSPPIDDGFLTFKDINYLSIIHDMQNMSAKARGSWIHDVPADSIKNLRVVAVGKHGEASVVETDCKIVWGDGKPPACGGLWLRMSPTGYPLCLEEKPKGTNEISPCRGFLATDEVTAKYQAGGYSKP